MTAPYIPGAGDLVWIDFDSALGREQRGSRPALVLSSRELSELAGFKIAAPITPRVRQFPATVVLLKGAASEGEVLLNQIRNFDALARPVKFAERVSENFAREVREKVDVGRDLNGKFLAQEIS
jgi:mRNA interferase MazF